MSNAYPPTAEGRSPILSLDDKLIFMHFAKTAGTTVHNLLCKLFKDEDICPERLSNIDQWPSCDLDKYKFFSAHASLEELSFIPQPSKTITFLRDPLERSISLYQYWKSFSNDFIEQNNPVGPRLAKAFSIKDFFSKEHFRQTYRIWNMYTAALVSKKAWYNSNFGKINKLSILNEAMDNISQLDFIGLSEDLQESMSRLCYKLDIRELYEERKFNVTELNHTALPDRYNAVSKIDMDEDLLSKLTEANDLDLQIYKHVADRFYGSGPPARPYECVLSDAIAGRVRVARSGSWIDAGRGGFIMHGPYVWLRPGKYQLAVEWQRKANSQLYDFSQGIGFVDVVAKGGTRQFAKVDISSAVLPGVNVTCLEFNVDQMFSDFEFRASIRPGVPLEINRIVKLTPLLA